RTGFAHLFEHLMLFTGSRNVPEGTAWALMEAAGARAGPDLNGTTSADRTNYFQQVPSHALERAFWIEADRMATLDDALNQAKLDNQREVVKNERRQSVDNQPYGLAQQKLLSYTFPEGHPYHHPVLGSMEDLTAASLEDVRAFFRTYYVPNNAVLAVTGDIDVDDAKALVRRYFGPIPRGADPPPLRDATLPPLIGAAQREVIQDPNAPGPAVYVGYRMPSARDARAPVVTLLGGLLASGRSSPLYRVMVREKQLATNVFAFNFGYLEGADLFLVGAIGRPGIDADSLEAALLAELNDPARLIDATGLERVQASARFGLVNQLQGMGGFGGRGDMLAMGKVYFDDAGWINRRSAQLAGVTLDQMRALAAERMVENNRTTLVFVPARAATGGTR
ncbi:MAG TPA: pitrilysin family protein, partial [Longimicrobiales bacterium]|nr:pitrilysin family protein [Longimicrobiales bacterium]